MPLPGFTKGDAIVHPSHGVGAIESIETQVISGHELNLCAITFARQKMTVRIPMDRLVPEGIRPLSTSETVDKVIATLGTPSPIRRCDQYRLIQVCEEKIQSGDLVATAKVARDLYRAKSVRETPYSIERTFQLAVDRLVDEIAVVKDTPEGKTRALILASLVEDRPEDD